MLVVYFLLEEAGILQMNKVRRYNKQCIDLSQSMLKDFKKMILKDLKLKEK